MTADLQSALFKAGLRVFEDLGLMLPNPDLDDRQIGAELNAAVRVEFSGAASGTLVVVLFGDILPDLVCNMLGETLPPTGQQQTDALREIGNVICGNMLPFIYGYDAVFEVLPPVVMNTATLYGEFRHRPDAQTQIGLEEGRADLHLFVTQPEEAAGVMG